VGVCLYKLVTPLCKDALFHCGCLSNQMRFTISLFYATLISLFARYRKYALRLKPVFIAPTTEGLLCVGVIGYLTVHGVGVGGGFFCGWSFKRTSKTLLYMTVQ
jgi:phosphatidylserine decarboxylase